MSTAEWRDAVLAIEVESRALSGPLSDAQFNWRPGENRWSIGECLNHLAITTGLMLEQLRPALEQGRAEQRTGAPPYRLGLMGGWFTRMMATPGKRTIPAPANFVPPSNVPKAEVLAAFFAVQEKLRNTILVAEGLALDRITARSAAKGGGWIRLNAAAWFASTLAHERRHLAQAKRVRAAPGFPG